jgi:hypothetical protein
LPFAAVSCASLAYGYAYTVPCGTGQKVFLTRKRNILTLFIAFLLLTPCLTAQNTGYMGKRVLFNVGTSLSPAWKRPTFADNVPTKYLAFNYILSPSIEIITSKTGTAGAVYHFFNTKYNTPRQGFSMETVYWDSVDHSPAVEKLTVHGFGIFYKQYLPARGRAPIGPYFRMQFDGFFFQCPLSYEDRTTRVSDQLFALKVEFGNDFLLFDRLRLSTGFSLGLPFGGFKGSAYEGEFFEIFYSPYQPFNEYARARIAGAYWLGFTVSIGFLAF